MPKNEITSPSAKASAERLSLTESWARAGDSSTSSTCISCWVIGCTCAAPANYNLCGGCGNGLSGCFEVETSFNARQCSNYMCFEEA